jgi:protein-disulfide isomerase
MKRALLAASLLVCTVASAQRLDPNAAIKAYAAKVLPRCPDGKLTVEEADGGPKNFQAFAVTMRSNDQYCGTQKYLLYSPKTQQVLVGAVVALPADGRPAAERVAEQSSKMLGKPHKATVAPFPLPDGLKAVSIGRDTPYGPFAYSAYLDASEQFMIVGLRGSMTVDPSKTIREALSNAAGARRGNPGAAVEIMELSDFQCPTCARAHQSIEPIIRQNLGKMSYVRIDLPLFEHHEWAIQAAMAARAIQRVAPNKYWDYVDYVFKNQESIGTRKFDDVLKDYLEDHDIDKAAVQKIYGSKAEAAALLEQVSRAFSLGIASTPTFLVNGQVLGFGPEGQFTIDSIKQALANAPAAAKPAKAPAKTAAKPAAKKTGK